MSRFAGGRIGAGVLAIATLALVRGALGSEPLTVNIDQAVLTRVPDRVATLVIGNPLIADVSLQTGGVLVITGKGYGATNLIALDQSGNVLTEKSIEVLAPRDKTVVVFRGIQRETYSCETTCERRITLGDSDTHFNSAITQTGVRTTQAQAQAQERE